MRSIVRMGFTERRLTALAAGALVALGEWAFHRYPAGVASYIGVALASRQQADHYGLWLDDVVGAGGVLRVREVDGSVQFAVTCASCHEAPVNGVLQPGRPNAAF